MAKGRLAVTPAHDDVRIRSNNTGLEGEQS